MSNTSAQPGHPSLHALRGWLIVFASAMLLYFLTASRHIQWQDSGQFVVRVVTGELVTRFGLALSHPLHFWISTLFVKLIPSNPPFAVSLVSALFGAIAVANVFAIAREILYRVGPAVLAAAGLAIAHTWWKLSTNPECYTLAAAMLTFEAWAILRWDRTRRPTWLIAMFAANGIGLSNHNIALLTGPVLAVILLLALWHRQASWRAFVLAALVWLMGAGLFFELIAREISGGAGVLEAMRSALFGTLYQGDVLNAAPVLRVTAVSLAFTALSFPNLMLPAAALGIIQGRRLGMPTLTQRALLAGLVIHLTFVLRYRVPDQYTFLLPAYALMAIFAGVGFAMLIQRRAVLITSVVLLVLTPVLYVFIPGIARRADVLGSLARNKPYRDDYRYLFTPWGRGDDSADQMSQAVADLANPDGLALVEDPMARFAVQYQFHQRAMNKATVRARATAEEVRSAFDAGRPVVFVPPSVDDVPPPATVGHWEKVGKMYILRGGKS